MKKTTIFCILSIIFLFQWNMSYAEKKPHKILEDSLGDSGDFFEDFEPADIVIMSGGSLVVRSGGVLDVQAGATFNVSGDFLVNTASTTAFRVQNGSGANVLVVDTTNYFTTVTTQTNNTTGFIVEQADGTNVLEISTTSGSATVRGDITFGAGTIPTIYPGTGRRIRIFNPNDSAGANLLEIQGDVSISGDLFNPAIFELQSGLVKVENSVDRKMETLSALERQVNKVNKEMKTMKETSAFSPEALSLAQTARERNLEGREIGRLISGKGSVADSLHTHKNFPDDVVFEKDMIVKGEGIYVKRGEDNREMISFAEQSAQALVSEVGIARLENGEAEIKLDPQFLELISISEATPLFIQITPGGNCKGLYVERVTKNGFTVKEQQGGDSNVSFYWKIEAVRQGLEGVKYMTPEQYREFDKDKPGKHR